MKSKALTLVDMYLLDHWFEIAKLNDAIIELNDKIKRMVDESLGTLQEQEWWDNKKFYDPFEFTKEKEINIAKRTWRVGKNKWDIITLGIWGLRSLDDLLGQTDIPPALYICCETYNQKELFSKHVIQFSQKILDTLNFKYEGGKNYPVYLYMSENADEWVNVLKRGEFKNRIMEYFDTLAKFIDPIDKAFEKIRGKK